MHGKSNVGLRIEPGYLHLDLIAPRIERDSPIVIPFSLRCRSRAAAAISQTS